MKKNLFILSSLVSRDFKLRYRRSFLGVLWSVLNPLLMMIVMTAVFSFMFKQSITHFALYLVLGQALFNFMVAATTGGLYSITSSAALIKKIRVEKLLFPVEKVIAELVNLVLSLIAVPAVMAYYGVWPTWRLLLVPLLLVYVTVFCVGLSLLLSTMAVFFRDIAHLWGVFTLAWTYLTPIFYPVSLLPTWLQPLERFNPMYRYATYFRNVVMNDDTFGLAPGIRENLICLGAAVIVLALGLWVFRANQRKFILYV